jgi:2-oxoglutarate dehydrogenase E1 component
MESYSYINNADPAYIDGLYQDYRKDPQTVDEGWRKFFQGFDLAVSLNGSAVKGPATAGGHSDYDKESKVLKLILAYRQRAHLLSTTNPIRKRKDRHPHLAIEDFGLGQDDLNAPFEASKEMGMAAGMSLAEIINRLNLLYTGDIGVEYMHIENTEEREWFRERYEGTALNRKFSIEDEKRILSKLNEAVVFENFLGTKFVGQKRFSLEGGETTIPALDFIINKAAENGVKEVVIGMAHRGRLNILANILGKTYEYIFSEFEGIKPDLTMGDGDVKYHMGFSSAIKTPSGKEIYVKLMPNPSHLEAVNSVVEGFSRAKADLLYNENFEQVLPVIIHGDAAAAGQGVVYEVAQMSQLKGYYTGGTMHFVINNQIGFTTDFDDARSSTYCTAAAYLTDSPILHVNGDDAEAVVYVCELATEYRMKFNKDVFVDMVCYRRHGHNEGDEPKYTQPALYNLIAQHPNPREVYKEALIKRGDIEAELAKNMEKEFRALLQDRLNLVKQNPLPYQPQPNEKDWASFRKSTAEDFDSSPDTAVSKKALDKIIKALTFIPNDFHPIKKVEKLLQDRANAYKDNKLDWALGELFAYGTLLLEGADVRMSGQDVIRGTFSHRHAAIFDEETSKSYCNLNYIDKKQADFRIYNSLLSEYAVLGFEYGYSIAHPNGLSIWEAQFGDFANGAQVMIDQFVASGESKWQRMSGIVLLLPHGYEGQGPEHSSARAERFLDLAAEYNIVVANCTTPANFFHIIRRQMKWPFRKPLVVLTPKSLLRHPLVVSPIEDFTEGKFKELIDDNIVTKTKVSRVLFCSGKVYYDLLAKQQADGRKDVAIVRVEQLYPMPEKQIDAIIKKYPKAEYAWVQEEPKNMGAWTYWLRRQEHWQFRLISRKSSASPATGFNKAHVTQQQDIVNEAFA